MNALRLLEKRKGVTRETLDETKIEQRVMEIKEGEDTLNSSKIKKLKQDLLSYWKTIISEV